VKRTLENRIRGWFPHEPLLISGNCRVKYEVKNPPLMIPEYTTSLTTNTAKFVLLWGIAYGVLFFGIFGNSFFYDISVFQVAASIIFGLTLGVILANIIIRRTLTRLLVNYKAFVFKDSAFTGAFLSAVFDLVAKYNFSLGVSFSDGLLLSLCLYGLRICY
jgi:hypothetical protein